MSLSRKILGTLAAAAAILAAILYWYRTEKSVLRATLTVSEYKTLPSSESVRDTTNKSEGSSQESPKRQALHEVIGAFLNGQVKNGSSKQVKGVTLDVPDAEYVCVRRDPANSECQVSTGVIAIGDLGSLQSVGVQVWLRYKPHVTAYKDIKLTDLEGRGKVDFITVQVPSGFIRSHPLVPILAVILVLLLWPEYLSGLKDFRRTPTSTKGR
jgi:hypothetical protein